MGDRRRTIQQPQQPPLVPSSIPRPSSSTLRQSLAPPTHNNNRQSLLPQNARASTSRQSIAPYSTYDQGGGASQSQSQPFSQGHGGPQVPMTASRVGGNMYHSQQGLTASVARQGVLAQSSRGSMAQSGGGVQGGGGFDYVPPS